MYRVSRAYAEPSRVDKSRAGALTKEWWSELSKMNF